MATVSKHQTVLYFDGFQSDESTAVFIKPEEEVPEVEEYRMDNDLWVEMGRPDVITLTVQPGDLLNAETPADFIGGKRVGGFSAQDL